MSSPAWVSLPSWAVFYLCSLPRTEADQAATSAKPETKSEQKNNNKNANNQPATKTEQKTSSAASQDPDAQARDAFLARVEEIKKMGTQPVRNQIFGALHGAAHHAVGLQVKVHNTQNSQQRDPHFFYWDFVDTNKRDEYYKKINFDYTHYLDSHSNSTNADPHHYYWEFLKDASKTGRDRRGSWTAANKQPNRERRGSVGLRGDARSAVPVNNNTNTNKQ